jgi:hypothetical protein
VGTCRKGAAAGNSAVDAGCAASTHAEPSEVKSNAPAKKLVPNVDL